MKSMQWKMTRGAINLDTPQVMAIVNVTPDSFSDGGRLNSHDTVLAYCEQLIAEGADILDVGAESTRPGAMKVSAQDEMARLKPILPAILSLGVPVSIDTYKPEIMAMALDMGIDIINDVHGFQDERCLPLMKAYPAAGWCAMHSHRLIDGSGQSLAKLNEHQVLDHVIDFFDRRLATFDQAGIDRQHLVLDPGYGFDKTIEANFALLRQQHTLTRCDVPLLAGWSRKSSLGDITGKPADQRLAASISAALIAVQQGASIVRVHDVAETVDALKVWRAVNHHQ